MFCFMCIVSIGLWVWRARMPNDRGLKRFGSLASGPVEILDGYTKRTLVTYAAIACPFIGLTLSAALDFIASQDFGIGLPFDSRQSVSPPMPVESRPRFEELKQKDNYQPRLGPLKTYSDKQSVAVGFEWSKPVTIPENKEAVWHTGKNGEVFFVRIDAVSELKITESAQLTLTPGHQYEFRSGEPYVVSLEILY